MPIDFEKRKQEAKKIQVANDHRHYRDRWRNIKTILDEISSKLSPLESQQEILLDQKILSPKEKMSLHSLLESLGKMKLATIQPLEGGYYNFDIPYRISVPDTEQFEEYRKAIVEFCEFIENDGIRRFPEVYASSILALKERRALVQDPSTVTFNEGNATLQWMDKILSLRPDSLEYYFCKALYQYPPHENIDWSEIYEAMTNDEPEDHKKATQSIKDTIKRLNRRAKEAFSGVEKLFSWSNKCVKRNF